MNAADVLAALRKHHRGAALVPEVVIHELPQHVIQALAYRAAGVASIKRAENKP